MRLQFGQAVMGAALALSVTTVFMPRTAEAISLGPVFAGSYTVADLGSVPGLPPLYGGLTFLPGDPDTLLIGGEANTDLGRLYTIGVTRDAGSHITGFSGSATVFGDVGEYNDGGVVFGPGGVLFTARWPVNELGQTKPGSTDEDRIDDLTAIGVTANSSISALNFVPAGFPGAGEMKIVTWVTGDWYTVVLSPDGLGTFDIVSATYETTLPGGPEGFVYIDGANAGFGVDSLLVADFSDGTVSAYDLDGSGNPIVASRRNFLFDLDGAEGAVIDPVTGDFLFSTFGGGDRIVRVSGFIRPPAVPEPASLALVGLGLVALRRHAR